MKPQNNENPPADLSAARTASSAGLPEVTLFADTSTSVNRAPDPRVAAHESLARALESIISGVTWAHFAKEYFPGR